MNRYWKHFFGRGLVASVEDFGSQGSLPTHPQLLDWLAAELMESGWDLQHIQRLIVSSATYQQTSRVSDAGLAADPENLWLTRGPRFRLSGAAIRDQALAAAGLLVRRIGGPSVKPYQPPGLWSEVSVQDRNRSTDFYTQDQGADLYRRGLYTFWKRSVAPPQLLTFDSAARESCVVRLTRTNTPLQALTLLNDVTMLEAARKMAERTCLESEDHETSARIRYLMATVGMAVDDDLHALLLRAWAGYVNHFAADPDSAQMLLSQGESAPSQVAGVPPEELAAYAVLAQLILNMDAVVTKE